MGKSTKRKQDELKAREYQVQQRLTTHRSKKPARGVVTSATEGLMTDVLHLLQPYYIRPIADWVYKGKSKDIDKQRLSLLRHLCGRYPVPSFLELPMISDHTPERGLDPTQSIVMWYVAVAQGNSLYKTCTKEFLTKRETHLLLQAPNNLKIKAAIWWAKTMAISGDVGVAYRIAQSRLIDRSSIKQVFWQDVHRFFTNNPVSLNEISDLLDYIVSEYRENRQWTIKKRTFESIRRKSEEWHRAQYKMKHIGGGSWSGLDVLNWEKTIGKDDPDPQKSSLITFNIRQILTGNGLATEGQAMRHCVASYKNYCMSGTSAIFSMTSSTTTKLNQRNLTIEVNVNSRRIVQARGYANRTARPQEIEMLREWARINNLMY